jgi:hypothetical protein
MPERGMENGKEHPCTSYVRETNRFIIVVLALSVLLLIFLALYSCRKESSAAPVPVLFHRQ